MVTFAVVRYLIDPELSTSLRRFAAVRAAVPEASVNEDRDFLAREYQVWLAEQTLAANPRIACVGKVT